MLIQGGPVHYARGFLVFGVLHGTESERRQHGTKTELLNPPPRRFGTSFRKGGIPSHSVFLFRAASVPNPQVFHFLGSKY